MISSFQLLWMRKRSEFWASDIVSAQAPKGWELVLSPSLVSLTFFAPAVACGPDPLPLNWIVVLNMSRAPLLTIRGVFSGSPRPLCSQRPRLLSLANVGPSAVIHSALRVWPGSALVRKAWILQYRCLLSPTGVEKLPTQPHQMSGICAARPHVACSRLLLGCMSLLLW